MNIPEEYLFILFLVLFPIIWFVGIAQMRNKMGMTKELMDHTGSLIRESGWGSANVNGVSLQNCVKVLEYTNGYELRVMGIFGGGKLWLPKNSTSVAAISEQSFFKPQKVTIHSGKNSVFLFGKLTKYVEQK
jgi:hypothetical protein